MGLLLMMVCEMVWLWVDVVVVYDVCWLLYMLEVVFVVVVVFIVVVMIVGVCWLVMYWFCFDYLLVVVVEMLLMLMVLVLLLWLCLGLYCGVVSGFECIVWLSGFNVVIVIVCYVLVIFWFLFVGMSLIGFFVF